MPTQQTIPASRLAAAMLGVLCLAGFAPRAAHAADAGAVARGAYLFAAADCASCHTDKEGKGAPLAGGRALKTEFGVFFAPNITSDKAHGIGGWSQAEFRRAVRQGKGKGGELLYPVFPYPSFAGMTDRDIDDIYAYLMAQPASAAASKPHQLKSPYGFRPLMIFWRMLNFRPGPLQPVAGQSAEWNRGRYLAEAVAHCQECHTPRDKLGALDKKLAYAGNPVGPDDQKTPNVTTHEKSAIAGWSVGELTDLLQSGAKPDGDYIGGGMAEVVEGTGKLTPADLKALVVYIKSLPPRVRPAAPAAPAEKK
jgi:mono/diheme cytochrome c family protein